MTLIFNWEVSINIPFVDQQFDGLMCNFMIFHMSGKVRDKGLEEIYRVLKPGGNILILDVVVPQTSFSSKLLTIFMGYMFKHELKELKPKMESTRFRQIEIARAKSSIPGLPLISFLRSCK